MKISVIIPTRNEAAIVEMSIRRAWECGADEVIVSDAGSTDSTVQLASSLECKLVHSIAGRGTQLNAGAKVATGEVFLFLHADTWLTPDGCNQIRDCISRYGPQACGAFQQRIENERFIYRLIELGNRTRVAWFSMAYGDQGIFVTKELFDSLAGFDGIPLMEDFGFSRRVSKHHRYKLLPGPLFISARRWEESGPVRQTLSNWQTVWAYIRGASPEELSQEYHRTKS